MGILDYFFGEDKKEYDDITSSEFLNIERKTNLIILDVRTEEEFKSGRIPNSINIDVLNTSSFIKKISELDKNKEVIVYCKSGVRSKKAASILSEKGFKKVLNLLGGIKGWKGKTVK